MKDKEYYLELCREESSRIAKGEKPNYLVISEMVGVPLISESAAVFWQEYTYEMNIETTIIECINYDWDKNEANFQLNIHPNYS